MKFVLDKYFLKHLSIEILLIALVSLTKFIYSDSFLEFGKILVIVALFFNFQQIIRFRKSDILFIFLFFSILYWFYLLAYYFFGIPYHYILEYQTVEYTNQVVFLQFIFQRLILVGINPENYKSPRFYLPIKKNNTIFGFLVIILVLLIPIATYGKKTIIGGEYSIDTDSSIWFEYNIIVFMVAFMYATSALKKNILIILGIIFMIIPLLYGRRLPFLEVFLTIFLLFFSQKFKIKYLLLFSIIGFLAVNHLGNIRNSTDVGSGIVSSVLSINSKGVMSNNQGGVVICATTYYGLIEKGIFDIFFGIKSFIGNFTGIFIPSSFNIEETYVNFEALNYANIPGNGGFTSIYFFIWGRYFGLIIGSLLLNYFIRNKSHSRLLTIYSLFILATFPRWYSYNVMILFKMGFWLIFLVALTDTFPRILKITNLNKK